MSTLANAVFSKDDSDSENDPDFVPAGDESSDDEERAKKDDAPVKESGEDEVEKKEKERKARAALWEDFQASVSSSSKVPENAETGPKPPVMVKIEKRHRFAGEEVVEVVEVPEDSQDAKKWPRWNPTSSSGDNANSTQDQKPVESGPSMSAITSEIPLNSNETNTAPSTTSATAVASSSTPKPKPKPGPRKSKTVLPGLPSGKPKKLTTLEKSAMDWRSHLSEQDGSTVDELERNRRSGGGGYLEKVEFMDRVEGRREELFEKEKGAKRRRL
ncbi:hypothetical protein SCHPADRAFT_891606 [Schizopora paradoxa]|uniref:SWR1-complex protein 5 n=1 Tax=Schizopora paradoxa TaxID=27342 RepID=A0A0H2RHN8_9AGAM|nr:hypothetical protein SCHPADRAFT_891606 [Schizopora paradoxa]